MSRIRATLLVLAMLTALVAMLVMVVTDAHAADDTPAAYGMDISHYQTITDPTATRRNGITFAYHKLSQGTGFVDPTAAGHLAQLRTAGILVGGYAYAIGPDCATDAHTFRSVATSLQLLTAGALIPALDMEHPALAAVADACVRAFYDALGGPLLVYGDSTWWTLYLHPATWGDRTIVGWIASYTGDPGHPATGNPLFVLHQHTSHGTIPGIPGPVDRDALIPGRALADIVLGETQPPAPLPMPACSGHIVRAGDTLSGIARSWGLSWPAVAAYNRLRDPNRIYPGQRICRPPAAPPSPGPAIYIVRPGDTLSGIAARLHYPGGWPALARHNRVTDANRIWPGQRLTV